MIPRARAAAACACEPPSAADQPARALLPPHMCAAAARGRAGGAVCAHLTCGRLPHPAPIWWDGAADGAGAMTAGVMCVRVQWA